MTNPTIAELTPPLRRVDAPSMSHTFAGEDDFDLTTMEGRIAFFCAKFECAPPALTSDPDESAFPLVTDELLEWHTREGASLDWTAGGHVGGLLRTRRKEDQRTMQFARMAMEFKEPEKRALTVAMKATLDGAPVEEAMAAWREVVEQSRASEITEVSRDD